MADEGKPEEALIGSSSGTEQETQQNENGTVDSAANEKSESNEAQEKNGTNGQAVPERQYDANGNPILTEAELLDLEIKNATLTSLESTRRMIQYCNAAKEAGINTLVMLDEQGGKQLTALSLYIYILRFSSSRANRTH